MRMQINKKYISGLLNVLFILIAVLGILGESAIYFSDLKSGKLMSFSISDQEDHVSEEADEDEQVFFNEIGKEFIFIQFLKFEATTVTKYFSPHIIKRGRERCITYRCLKWFLWS